MKEEGRSEAPHVGPQCPHGFFGGGPCCWPRVLLAGLSPADKAALLDRWDRLASAATDGPWAVSSTYDGSSTVAIMRSPDKRLHVNAPDRANAYDEDEANAAFVAAARTAVPALLAEVRRLCPPAATEPGVGMLESLRFSIEDACVQHVKNTSPEMLPQTMRQVRATLAHILAELDAG